MQILRICKEKNFYCLLLCTCVLFACVTGVYADTVPKAELDYGRTSTGSIFKSPQKIEQEADDFFYKGVAAKDKNVREAYLVKALAKYKLLLTMQPDNAVFCTQIGVILELNGHKSLAKNYFFRAINLEKLNPFANYYFAEYYFNMKDYYNALKYYKVALKNGYGSYYEVHNRLATVYEKLGDLEKAKDHYTVSRMLNPRQKELKDKILILGHTYYNKKEYQLKPEMEY